jgi:hypothetical protein
MHDAMTQSLAHSELLTVLERLDDARAALRRLRLSELPESLATPVCAARVALHSASLHASLARFLVDDAATGSMGKICSHFVDAAPTSGYPISCASGPG